MDLSTIKEKLEMGEYMNPWEFCDDVWLMFDNAWLYNRKNSKVYKYCTKVITKSQVSCAVSFRSCYMQCSWNWKCVLVERGLCGRDRLSYAKVGLLLRPETGLHAALLVLLGTEYLFYCSRSTLLFPREKVSQRLDSRFKVFSTIAFLGNCSILQGDFFIAQFGFLNTFTNVREILLAGNRPYLSFGWTNFQNLIFWNISLYDCEV